jgi:hypothetical protein
MVSVAEGMRKAAAIALQVHFIGAIVTASWSVLITGQ